MSGTLDNIKADDEVVITGTSSSPRGVRFVGLRGVVATVSRDPDEGVYVKVWPWDDEPLGQEVHGGKVWFPEAGVESVEVVPEKSP